ncbi:MAG: hypothetical protein P1V36_09805, partial [Planctomycetota bacterium]|nr:hypothetical protein [Planctomycetota bacterium]
MTQVLRALLLTLLVGILLAGGIWLLRGDTTGLRKPAVAFFEAWWQDHPTDRATAKEFEGAASAEAFHKLRELYNAQLGAFEGAGETVKEWSERREGHISIELRFERGTGTGRFDFVLEDGEWKIKRFRLDLPREDVPKTGGTDAHVFCRKLLVNWGKANWEVVWEQFTPDLRAQTPPKAFGERTKAFMEAHGSPTEVVETSFDDGDKTVRAALELVYPDTRRAAKVVLVWEGGRWYVSTFQVEH